MNEALRTILQSLTPRQQALIGFIATLGPVTATELANKLNVSAATITNDVKAIRTIIGDAADIRSSRQGYEWAVASTQSTPPSTMTIAPIDTVTTSAPTPPVVDDAKSDDPSPPTKKRKHVFELPWGGVIDLYSVIGCDVDSMKSQLIVQLHGGGYIRGPVRGDARVVAVAITRAIKKLDGVAVTVMRGDDVEAAE